MAGEILQLLVSCESWTEVFPDKRGDVISIVATSTPLYDDEGTLVGDICTSVDAKLCEEAESLLSVRRDYKGIVYRALWNGSDVAVAVAVEVFYKQEYSDDLISSFRQEVPLMKRLRHPNILLFMGAVTSPQRLCIVTEFLPRLDELLLNLFRNEPANEKYG